MRHKLVQQIDVSWSVDERYTNNICTLNEIDFVHRVSVFTDCRSLIERQADGNYSTSLKTIK